MTYLHFALREEYRRVQTFFMSVNSTESKIKSYQKANSIRKRTLWKKKALLFLSKRRSARFLQATRCGLWSLWDVGYLVLVLEKQQYLRI
jgi:hypothetical protein